MNKKLLYFKLPLLVIIFFHTNVISQFSPLYVRFFSEEVRGANLHQENIVFLHRVAEYPAWGSNLTPEDVLGSFSSLFIYDAEGEFIKKLQFPDNDSIYHYGAFMRKTDSDKIIVAGQYWYKTMESAYNPFIAVINEIYEFDTIFYFNHTIVDIFTEQLIISGDTISHFIKYTQRNFNLDLELTQQPINRFSCLEGVANIARTSSMFSFNNYIYRLYFDLIQTNTQTILQKFENDNSICEVVYDETEEEALIYTQKGERAYFASSGARLNSNAYLVHGRTDSSNVFVAKVDSSENVSVIFFDSTTYSSISMELSTLDFSNNTHIYFAYAAENNDTQGILLYCLNNETFRWKKFFPLNEGLEFGNFIPLNQIVATPKNDCLITINIKGFQDASDVYILRVDSNGNAKDFVTSVAEIEHQALFSVYPNPTEGVINFNGNYKSEATLSIFNSVGQILQTNKLANNQNQIDISHFSKGIYFYQINSLNNEILKSGKFMKQ